MDMTQTQNTERFIVQPIIKFGMLFGYRVYDNLEKKSTVYDEYNEDEEWSAKSKAGLMNALYNN
jgi:predicted negative regulator of RcsB-dependent stress response